MSLVEKIRKARETSVEAGGRRFVIRRPTDEEALANSRAGASLLDVVRQFTIGWEMTELDLIPGGSPTPVPFSAELFGEWVADQPSIWEPLGNAILAAYKAHADKRGEAVKN